MGYGYDGIIVAWLARLNPLAVPVVALLLGTLIVGGEQLQAVLHLPASISMVLEAVLLFGLLRWQLRSNKRASLEELRKSLAKRKARGSSASKSSKKEA